MGKSRLVHVVGAGLAGLSAATRLTELGHRVRLYESTGIAGGRCRSFHDERLGCVIDNGNHLILSGNVSTHRYLSRIHALDRMQLSDRAAFPFMDLATGRRWVCDFGAGRGIFKLLSNAFQGKGEASGAYGIPEASLREIVTSAYRFWRASEDATVCNLVGDMGDVYHRLWEPLSIAVMNTETETAMAKAMWPVLRETLGKGPDGCRPVLARDGLGNALVEPALDYLKSAGEGIRYSAGLKSLISIGNNLSELKFNDFSIEIAENDRVILALPIAAINELLPSIQTPNEYRPIINAHFGVSGDSSELTIIGLINGRAQWIFRKNGIVSVTVSAAQELADVPVDQIAEILWRDVCKAFNLGQERMGAYRIIKEKRATFAQTPEQNRRRPRHQTSFQNLFLAGDWIATGLPATIEGAIRSGETAANAAIRLSFQ